MENKELVVGNTYYFITTVENVSVVSKGVLSAYIPKYNFTDAFDSNYKRASTYIFDVLQFNGKTIKKSIELNWLIFKTIRDAVQYCPEAYFDYSCIGESDDIRV